LYFTENVVLKMERKKGRFQDSRKEGRAIKQSDRHQINFQNFKFKDTCFVCVRERGGRERER
jgi:hypothetical protein